MHHHLAIGLDAIEGEPSAPRKGYPTPASWVFGFITPSLTQKECSPCFAGSRRYQRSSSGGCGGPVGWRLAESHGRRSKAGGVTLTIHRRLPRQRRHVAAPHWSVKSDVIM
jgi:hypothetical protein